MHIRVPRRLFTSLAAGAMGLALVAGSAACSSGGGGLVGGSKKSTTDVCNDTVKQTQGLIAALTTSMGTVAANPNPSADQQQQAITAVKQTFTNIAKLWRQEAGTASDSGLADALNKAADQVDAANAKISSFSDLESLDDSSFDSSSLDKYCPDASFGE
jgi:predicted phage tail protein